MKIKYLKTAIALLMMSALNVQAESVLYEQPTLEKQLTAANTIVIGYFSKAADVFAYQLNTSGDKEDRRVFSEYPFQVKHPVRNEDLDPTIRVRLLGGKVDNLFEKPIFDVEPEKEVLLILTKTIAKGLEPAYTVQFDGFYSIEDDTIHAKTNDGARQVKLDEVIELVAKVDKIKDASRQLEPKKIQENSTVTQLDPDSQDLDLQQ